MSRLLSSALSLRRDPRMLKLPPYLSFLCVIVGIVWLLLLPLDDYARKTYISENALLPGQVHTYFGGSEQNVLRAYRKELEIFADASGSDANDKLEGFMKGLGVKVGRQNYTYYASGFEYSGENVYGILQAPRGDATEAIVLVAAWRSIDDQLNRNGVALALTLARYFKRWSLWSKDIILVFPPDSRTGIQAWVDAYHDAHDSKRVAPLPLKSGALQGALALDYPLEHRFEAMHIIYDGVNGQLPNLDLINSVANIASGQMGIHTFIQEMRHHNSGYMNRLQTIARGMMKQGLGNSAGPHSSFIPYHVDAVTLQPYGKGWHDEMAMGRVIEGSFRSLNNLLEHLHQSFFFYLLMQRDRFVSIGTYLPSAMILSANFTIMAIFLWVKGRQSKPVTTGQASADAKATRTATAVSSVSASNKLLLPVSIVLACHVLAVIPLFLFNHLPGNTLSTAFINFTGISAALPFVISHLLEGSYGPSAKQYQIMKSFSLLIMGASLATLSTLNFSLSFLVSLFAAPLSFVQPSRSESVKLLTYGAMNLLSPAVIIYSGALSVGLDVGDILKEASFGWNVWRMYTPIVVWGIWWPAWIVGMVHVLGVPVAE